MHLWAQYIILSGWMSRFGGNNITDTPFYSTFLKKASIFTPSFRSSYDGATGPKHIPSFRRLSRFRLSLRYSPTRKTILDILAHIFNIDEVGCGLWIQVCFASTTFRLGMNSRLSSGRIGGMIGLVNIMSAMLLLCVVNTLCGKFKNIQNSRRG